VLVGSAVNHFHSGKDHFSANAGFSRSMLRFGLLAMVGLIVASPAEAAIFWSDSDPVATSEPAAAAKPKRQKRPRRTGAAKPISQIKEATKPQGPLVIAISIDRQMLKVYDANGLYAESPVSTGMRGHATPMGVFSVIQKDKFHRSNIYSNAPMPYMQRITWSGVAIHAGALPGYPASHGCVRMPMAFAVKMWSWTRMGARVVIAPGELSPSEISHPMLAAQRPTPMAAAEPARAPAVAADVPAFAHKPQLSSLGLEMKPAVDGALNKAVAEATGAKRDQTQTADATGAMVTNSGRATLSDATTTVPGIMVEKLVAAAKPVEIKDDQAPGLNTADTAKDESRQPDAAQTSLFRTDVAELPKRSGQIAVFVSRKDNKVYVRQNFAPLFDVPITITASDRPLGTHVFTARADKNDARTFHWSVVSMPAARRVEDDGATRRRKSTGAIDMSSAAMSDSAAEALDRIKISEEAMVRINEVLAAGSSMIVSDLGIASGGETGSGTEFVVPLR
jgi:lipoprotein-anchoring transpeptidase ErfK/SrfK